MNTIGLVAAMPEEVKPLLKKIGHYRSSKTGSFELFHFSVSGKQVTLIRSGMGQAKAKTATDLLIEQYAPDIIINFGFAGAVTNLPQVGDLMIAEQVVSYDGGLAAKPEQIPAALADHLLALIRQNAGNYSTFRSTFITAAQITEKAGLGPVIAKNFCHPVLEMESAAVAAAAAKATVPFAAVRAISDAADEELEFSIDQFTDNEMNISIIKVLATVARKPTIIPQLLRLAKNARIAGENLAQGMETLIRSL